MSISALNWAFEQDLPHAEKSVLVALAHRADKDGYCYPGQKAIAAMTGASESTVRRAIKSLDEAGYLSREDRRRKNGSRTSTRYHLPVTMTANQPVTMTGREKEPTGHHDTPLPVTMTGPPDKSVIISQNTYADAAEKTNTMIQKNEPTPTARTLIAEWIDGMPNKPPGRIIGHLSKEIKNLLEEGYDYQLVRQATILWSKHPYGPSALPSFLNQIINKPAMTEQKPDYNYWSDLGNTVQDYLQQNGYTS